MSKVYLRRYLSISHAESMWLCAYKILLLVYSFRIRKILIYSFLKYSLEGFGLTLAWWEKHLLAR